LKPPVHVAHSVAKDKRAQHCLQPCRTNTRRKGLAPRCPIAGDQVGFVGERHELSQLGQHELAVGIGVEDPILCWPT